MNLQQENYDVIEIFEENPNQLILLAVENTHYEGVVIINKIIKSPIVNAEMLRAYKDVSSSIINIDETEDQVIIINSYKDTQLLSDYLTENTLDFNERIRLAKSFLSHISKYAVFSYPIQQLLLHADQLTIRNDVLIFSDYIFLENYDENCTQNILLIQISKILKIILQLHKEALTSEIATLNQFLDTLDTNIELYDYNKLYNDFKILATNLDASDEIIHYTELTTLDTLKNGAPKVDLDYIKNKKQIRLAKSAEDVTERPQNGLSENTDKKNIDSKEELKFDIDTPSLIEYDVEELTDLGINPNFAVDFDFEEETIELITETDESVDEVTFDESDVLDGALFAPTESFDNNNITTEIMSILDDLQIGKKKEEAQTENPDSLLDNLLTDSLFESWLDKEDDLTLVEVEDEDADETLQAIVEETILLEEEIFSDPFLDVLESVPSENMALNNDFMPSDVLTPVDAIKNSKLNVDKIIKDTQDEKTEIPIEELVKNIESLLEKDLYTVQEVTSEVDGFDEFKEEINAELQRLDESSTSSDLIELVTDGLVKDSMTSHDEPKQIENEQENAVDHISDILNRNDKEHSNLFISNDKKKSQTSYYVPSFLAFFISLLVITTLLLYYTSTYI